LALAPPFLWLGAHICVWVLDKGPLA
jgi:hypothetical protein